VIFIDEQVSRLVRENLTKRALRFNLVLDDVSITHVAFSPEFTHAVEAKQVFTSHLLFASTLPRVTQVAQQTALRAAFLVDQAIQEKQVCILHLRRYYYPYSGVYSLLLSGHRVKLRVRS
jgi:hypothetical protein